jgi:ribosomal protein S18 acetylase RimI-like enzyme
MAASAVASPSRPLPRPSTRTRLRKEIQLRPGTGADAAACVLLDSTYTTNQIWQLDSRQDGDDLRIAFRQVKLPRDLTLIAPHHPPALAGGLLRRGVLWLVAEEVEVGGGVAKPRGGAEAEGGARRGHDEAAPSRRPAWAHTVRRSSGGTAASVQLGLPGSPEQDAPETDEPEPRGKIVGYVVAAGAPRDGQAYLRTLVVDKRYRRAGTGARLLAEAKRWAARLGADSLIADAPARNFPAIRLLQKAGFAFCGFNDSCYDDKEVAVFFCARLR